MEADIHKVLEWLDILIGDGPAHAYFNAPANKEEIASFEERQHIRLPDSYKAFLLYANGGMIISDRLNSLLDSVSNSEDVKWNANYLYSLEEVEKEYKEKESWNFGLPGKDLSPYPFIPFCHTDTGEYLVFINLIGDESESGVFDAFHEETIDTWGLVADDFTAFLSDYTQSNGNPNVLGDLEKGSALDIIEHLIDEEEEDKSPEYIISETSNNLKRNPDDAWQLMLRGMAYKDLEEYEKALDDFNLGISLKSDDAYYYFCRGNLFLALNKMRLALIDFDTAAKYEPEDTLYLNHRALVLMDKGKLDIALADLNRAIQLEEDSILSYMLRERLFMTMGEDEKADADAKEIEELQSKK